MALTKLPGFTLDSTSNVTFANTTVTGNLTSGNANLGNLATSNYFSGSGNLLSNIQVANVTGLGNLATVNKDGNSSNILYGNGVFASAPVTYGNSNVVTLLSSYGSNTIVTTGNITGGNIIGIIAAGSNTITTTGNANVGNLGFGSGVITGTGNITAGNANLGNAVTANYFIGNLYGTANLATYATTANAVAGANVSGAVAYATTANAVAGANVSGFVPNANIANTAYAIAGANVSGQVGNALLAGTVYTNAQPNITSVGTLSSLSVTGDIGAANLVLSGNLTVSGTTTTVNSTTTRVVDPIIEQGGGANGAALSSNDSKDRGTLLHYYTGSTATDAFMGWDNSNAEFAFASNVTVASEVATFNNFGNVRANVYFGNGSQLTGISTSYAIANGTSNISIPAINGNINLSSAGNANIVVVTGTGVNIAGYADLGTGNLTTAGNVSFSGANVTLGAVGNLHVTGGTANQYLKTDGSGTLSWGTPAGGAGLAYTAAATPPGTANVADQWFNTTTNTLYEYINDGSANYWVDIQSSTISTASTNATLNVASFITRTYAGTGSQVNFTITTGLNVSTVLVVQDGVVQTPTSDYTVSGALLTFTTAPANGSTIQIRELGYAVPVTTSLSAVSSLTLSGTLTSTSLRAQSMTMGIIFGG